MGPTRPVALPAWPLATQIERPELLRGGEVQPLLTVPALARLVADLVASPISWCSWKSNEHLAKALAGRTDVDLLVDVADVQAFRLVLAAHGVKPLAPAPSRDYPGMEHHLGMDPDTGQLFHLHVHTRLVLGEQHVKNHRLTMEDALLSSVRSLDGVPVPAPELELAILSVRALLKYRARDIVKDVLSIRTPGLKHEVRVELDWLLAQTDVERVRAALRGAGEFRWAPVACAFLEVYQRDPRSGWDFARMRSRLRRALARERRVGRAAARVRGVWAGLSERRRTPRMSPAAGGVTVALVGSDGSGKSTLAAEMARWLDWKVATRVIYLGSKSPSLPARWSYVGFRVLRRTGRAWAGRFGERSGPARAAAATRDVTLALHELTVGRDRTRRCREGRRAAEQGCVVFFDRYPMDALSGAPEHRVLDGPRIMRVLPEGGAMVRRLARVEERRYERLGLPDVLVFLRVDPEVARERKPDHLLESLQAKTRAAEELAVIGEHAVMPARMVRVDAGRPLADVLLDLKGRIWDVL